MRNGSTRLGSYPSSTRIVGAGGWVTGGDIANDGTIIVRTDTYNAYALAVGGSTWVPQIRANDSVAAASLDLFYSSAVPWGYVGTYDVAIAPSNSAVRAVVQTGYVWITTDAGVTYFKANLAQQANCLPNEANRMNGKMLVFDPQNPNILWFGSPQGLFKCTAAQTPGAAWTAISTATIPVPTAGSRYCIAYDPSSAVASGAKQGICVFIPGTGIKRSTDGGGSWSAITAPTTGATVACHMKINANSQLFLCGAGGENTDALRIYNLTAGTWSYPGKICKSVAFSPHNAGHVYSCGGGSHLDVSLDYGATWAIGTSNTANNVRQATNITWHQNTFESYMSNGDILFDPVVNRIWTLEGIGVWRTGVPPTNLTFGSNVTWTEWSLGIENMVTGTMTFSPDGKLGYACQDRGTFLLPKGALGKTFPAQHAPGPGNYTQALYFAQMADYAPEDTDFWVTTLLEKGFTYTTDGGATWSAPSTALMTASGNTGGGGQIAVLSKDIWIIGQLTATPISNATFNDRNALWLTTNRGVSWTKLTIGDNSAVWVSPAYYICRRALMKDKFNAGRALFYNVGDVDNGGSAGDLACRGVWQIDVNLTSGVPTITRKSSVRMQSFNRDNYHGKLNQIGVSSWTWVGGDGGLGLWRTSDGGATWSEATGSDDQGAGTKFAEVFGVGVGKAAAGSLYPTLLALGYRMDTPATATNADVGKYGAWMSTDNGATWTRIAQFFGNAFDCPNDIVGDMSTFGRFVIGYSGSGAQLVSYDYKLRAS